MCGSPSIFLTPLLTCKDPKLFGYLKSLDENFFCRDVLKLMEINDVWTMAIQDTGIKLPKKKVKVEQGLPKKISMWRMISSLSPLISMNVLCLLKIFWVKSFLQIILYPFNIRTKHHRVPNHFLRTHVVKGTIMISSIWKESHVHCIHCFIPFVRGSSYMNNIFLDFLKVLEMLIDDGLRLINFLL